MPEKTVLVMNSGSSSVKASLFDSKLNRLFDVHIKEYPPNFQKVFEALQTQGAPLKPTGIGHRFVHGGENYRASTLVDAKVLHDLESLIPLAPLHNEACLNGIKACTEYFGQEVKQAAVFDTAFHHTIPEYASNYAIDHIIAEKYKIKRYGFHGISHSFLWDTYKKKAKRATAQSKIITAHLGNGCSITAIDYGQSVETSMGFTPAEGLIMATRAGDIDAAIVEFLCIREKKAASEIMDLLNFHSGLLGISGISPKLQTLIEKKDKDPRANLAIDMFCHRIVKYVGAYLATLKGAEAILFSGGIGENAPYIRQKIANAFSWFGVNLDDSANESAVNLTPGTLKKISTDDSSLSLYVVATDENRAIARETLTFL